MNKSINLSTAQQGAIEYLYLDSGTALADAWIGRCIVFDLSDAESLWCELIDASNSEEALAEHLRTSSPGCAKMARRAARSLACVASKVLRV